MNRAHLANLGLGIMGLAALTTGIARADEPLLKAGDYVAVIGDSITEQKQYSVFIEDYLLMCKPAGELSVTQFGWGGETTWGFAGRMQNDMVPFGATAATINFGMNDGGYSPQNPEKAKHYHDAYTSIVEQLKKAGVKTIVVGSPGCVDSDTYHHDSKAAEAYNKTLGSERDIARQVAEEQHVAFANVFDPMMAAMEKAKAKYGNKYALAGGDGVHPGANGHLVMAYAYLKALGCDGNIGTITVDLAANSAKATDGHKILSTKTGTIEVESSRYPFCFTGDPTQETSASAIEFFPFNQDLNRLTLVVTGAEAGKQYNVTWGSESKAFSGEALGKGINLAAEFVKNPFSQAFAKVEEHIRAQQNFETPLVKQTIHGLPQYEGILGEDKESLSKFRSALAASDKPRRAASAAAVEPVKHTIVIEAVK